MAVNKIISIYNGSPRKTGNTAFATNFLKKELETIAGAKVKHYSIIDYHIEPCFGCRKCMELKHCTNRKDEFEFLFNTVKNSDITIWGVPVYWFAPPGITKNFIDRTHAYFVCKPMLHNQKTYIINIGTNSGFETSESVMKSWLEWYGANIKKSINIFATEINDIKNNNSKIKQLKELTEEIIRNL